MMGSAKVEKKTQFTFDHKIPDNPYEKAYFFGRCRSIKRSRKRTFPGRARTKAQPLTDR